MVSPLALTLAGIAVATTIGLAPSATAAGVGSVDVANASFETDADGNGFPGCWGKTASGVNTGDWTTTNDAHSGSVALRGQITSYASGNRKVILDRGTPSCLPTVTIGSRAWR